MLGLGGAWLVWRSASVDIAHQRRWVAATLILVAAGADGVAARPVALATGGYGCGRQRVGQPGPAAAVVWLACVPLAIWTLWRWRKQIASTQWHRHLWLPLWFSLVSVGATISTAPADRALLLGLPAMATLAAFALPTLEPGGGCAD